MKTIITTGSIFADIDALACGVAYKELLSKKIDVELVLVGPLNNTVTKSVLKWNLDFKNTYQEEDCSFILVDVSNKDVLPDFVKPDKIIEVWDHRFGYQDFWKEKNTRVVIDEVGACATLIWEEFKRKGVEGSISTISANLLYTAIFSNTLNFKSLVTTSRDRNAFAELSKYVSLPPNWIEMFYQESEKEAEKHPDIAIRNDTKVIDIPEKHIKMTIGQIELWKSHDFITKNRQIIKETLLSFGNEEWFMSAPSISEGINYLYTENEQTKKTLCNLLDATFQGDIGVTNKLSLRKEILKKMLQ